MSELKLKFMWD